MNAENQTKRDREKFFFQELLNEIIIELKGELLHLSKDELEEIQKRSGLSRGVIEGYFGYDSSKAGRFPNKVVRDTFAQLAGYIDFNAYIKEYLARTSKINKHTTLNPPLDISSKIIDNIKAYYTSKMEFNSISFLRSDTSGGHFKMSDFYIDVSYINRHELKTGNDYFVIEKEGSSYKRNRKSRNEIFTNYFSIEVVTESLILKDDHVVLLGNPGVGKTTYAKWICNRWASGNLHLERIPFYLPCRDLPESSPNAVISYICDEYCKGDYEQSRLLLESNQANYVLFIDGYDEASSEQRTALERDLKRLTKVGDYPHFVLLSRPYALVDSPFKKIPDIYELIGFNDVNRLNYIRSFFEKIGKAKELEKFSSFVDANPILKDLSYNPLHLSYITSIFCSENGFDTLKAVQSSYDLSNEALKYIINYHTEEKRIKKSDFIALLDTCIPFIADLELELAFVYHEKSAVDKNYRYAETLSRLGIGRVEHNKPHNKWSFYMLNIHYQEILATEHFGPRLTKDALLYLLGNPLYWQLAKLLTGYLISNGKNDVIVETLKELRANIARSLNHNARLYFILLAELPEELLNEIILEADINYLIEFYRWLHNDSVWNNLYFESLTKIYAKLNQRHKDRFESTIITLIEMSLTIPKNGNKKFTQTEISQLSFPPFLLTIADRLQLCSKNEILLKTVIGKYVKLEILSQAYYKRIERILKTTTLPTMLDYWAEDEIDHSRYSLLTLLDQMNEPEPVTSYFKILWAALETSTLHANLIARVLAKIRPIQFFIDEFNKIARAKQSKDDDIIMLSLLCISMTATSDYDEQKNTVIALLTKMRALLDSHLQNTAGEDMKTHVIARNNYALALAQTDDLKLFPDLVWANYYQNRGFHIMGDIDVASCDQIFSSFFAKLKNSSPQIDDLLEFNSMVMSLDIGNLTIGKYYPELFAFFEKFVWTHKNQMSKMIENTTLNRFEPIDDPIATELYNLTDVLQYPSRIKKLLEDIFNNADLMQNPFIRNYYVPFLLKCEIPVYEDKYWVFILQELISDAKDLSLVINIFFHNSTIYLYESNLQYLTVLWEKLSLLILAQKDETFISGGISDILTIAYRSLRLNYDLNGTKKTNALILSVVSILKMPLIKKYLYRKETLYHEDAMLGLAAYPLASLYLKDRSLMLDDKFDAELSKLDQTRVLNFISEMAIVCNFNAPLFKNHLGIKIHKRLSIYCNIYHKEDHVVIPDAFKLKLHAV